jgi:hypothetical protein
MDGRRFTLALKESADVLRTYSFPARFRRKKSKDTWQICAMKGQRQEIQALYVCGEWTPNAAMPANNRLRRTVRDKALQVFKGQRPSALPGR